MPAKQGTKKSTVTQDNVTSESTSEVTQTTQTGGKQTTAKTAKTVKATKTAKSALADKPVKTTKTTKTDTTAKTAKTTKTAKTSKTTKVAKTTKKVASTKSKTPKPQKQTNNLTGGDETEHDGESNARYFKVIYNNQEAHGRFSGAKPKQAANKALTSICKSIKKSGGDPTGKQIKFSITECSRNSKHKTYNYIGEKIQLDKPIDVTIHKGKPNEKVINYRSTNKVMKDKGVVAQA